MKIRESNYDLLRILACIAVIGIHASATYINMLYDNDFLGGVDNNVFITILLNSLTRFAVPCFVMLSGAFILYNKKNMDYCFFYKKTIKKIFLPTILFSFIYFLFGIFLDYGFSNIFSHIIDLICGIPTGFFWYLWMIMGLYLMVPFIIRLINCVGEKTLIRFVLFYFLLAIPVGMTTKYKVYYAIGQSFNYLGYFILGYILRKNSINKKNNIKGLSFIMIGLVIATLNAVIRYKIYINYHVSEEQLAGGFINLSSNFNPLNVIYSLLVFVGFSYIDTKKDYSKISNLTFYIFLFHFMFLTLLEKLILKYELIQNNLAIFCVEIILTFLLSTLISYIYMCIKKYIEKKYAISELIANKIIVELRKLLKIEKGVNNE